MVQVVENSKKLVITLSENLGYVSEYKEWISEVKNANVKKIKTKFDSYPFPLYAETTYEITPLSDDTVITVTIRDDNNNDWGYHFDYLKYHFDGKQWTSEYKPNPKYH